MDNPRYTKESVILLLKEKQNFIFASGESRLPKRNDFSDYEVSAIKSYLGPWPRALEAAGLKPPRDTDRITLNREKRIRAKRNRNQIKKEGN